MLPDGLLSFPFLSSLLSWFAGRGAPRPRRLSLFRNSHFGWRISGLSQAAAQNQFFYALCSPRLDPAL
jgi:hypothetical protein